MTPVHIRPATADDIPEVARVFRASFSAALPWIPTLHTPDEDRRHFGDVVFTQSSVHVAEDDATGIVGFIAFDHDTVNHLYLLPQAQRQGIGSRLLEVAQQSATRLQLWAF